MKHFTERIWKDGEYNYPAAYGFVPKITSYLHDDENVRPCMLVVPGGGYCMVCNVEGEAVAEEFYNRGMNAFVLTYTTDITMSVPLEKQPLNDASRAIRYIRKNAERFCIDASKLTICGFSAGGHLCASISTLYADVKDPDAELDKFSNRPDATVLGYPVITAGEKTHLYSIYSLLGWEPSKEGIDYFSCEKHVDENTPPAFVWQTVEDDLVPVENSALYTEALCKNHVPYAYYAFPNGRHGLSVQNDRVRKGDFGEPYTFEQLDLAIENVKNNTAVNVSKARHDELMIQFFGNVEGIKDENAVPPVMPEEPVYEDVVLWPTLCATWLKRLNLI